MFVQDCWVSCTLELSPDLAGNAENSLFLIVQSDDRLFTEWISQRERGKVATETNGHDGLKHATS